MIGDINYVTRGGSRGETSFDRPITEEQYLRAKENNDRLTEEDGNDVLTASERLGYGGSTYGVFEQGGQYYVHCHRWNNCD